MSYTNKILYGLDKIHYSLDGKTIKPILGALDIEIILTQDYIYANKNGNSAIRINGPTKGKGKLTLLGLTLEEQADLFGYKYKNGELVVSGNYNPNPLSLLFSRQKADGGELYTIVYKCVFNNPNINGKTLQGAMEEDVMSLDFDVFVDNKINATYITLDTKGNGIDTNRVNNFFKEIQMPMV